MMEEWKKNLLAEKDRKEKCMGPGNPK